MARTVIYIDGKPWPWTELLKIRREQQKAKRQPQPTLFPVKEDARPASQRKADGRYEEPTLFSD